MLERVWRKGTFIHRRSGWRLMKSLWKSVWQFFMKQTKNENCPLTSHFTTMYGPREFPPLFWRFLHYMYIAALFSKVKKNGADLVFHQLSKGKQNSGMWRGSNNQQRKGKWNTGTHTKRKTFGFLTFTSLFSLIRPC